MHNNLYNYSIFKTFFFFFVPFLSQSPSVPSISPPPFSPPVFNHTPSPFSNELYTLIHINCRNPQAINATTRAGS